MEVNPYQAPAHAGGYGAGAAASGGTYEFNSVENETIQKLARRCGIWGWFQLITGAMMALGVIGMAVVWGEVAREIGVDFGPGPIVGAGLVFVTYTLVMGFLYVGAGKNLSAVVRTEGNDIELMLGAIKRLGRAFWIEFAFAIAAFVGAMLAIFAVVAMMM